MITRSRNGRTRERVEPEHRGDGARGHGAAIGDRARRLRGNRQRVGLTEGIGTLGAMDFDPRRVNLLHIVAFHPRQHTIVTPDEVQRFDLDRLHGQNLAEPHNGGDWSLTNKGLAEYRAAPLIDGFMPEVRDLLRRYAHASELHFEDVLRQTNLDKWILDAAICDGRYFRILETDAKGFVVRFTLTDEARERGRSLS